MKKILITGATGVIGRQVLPELVHAGHQVSAVTRSPEKAAAVTKVGAEPVTLDLFNPDAVAAAVAGCDAVIHLATNIPLGVATMRASAWKTNDRLRTEAADNLASAVIAAGVATYIGESTTFQYLDGGADWISESQPRKYHDGSRSVLHAEAAAQRVTDAGLVGVILRFAMFHAADSGHLSTFLSLAKRGVSPFIGPPTGYQSFVDSGDAARAVLAALDVGSGIYNVAEPNPRTRAEHSAELARVLDKKKLRPVPSLLLKAGGPAGEEQCRSQRISSQALQHAGAWEPRVDVISRWKDVT